MFFTLSDSPDLSDNSAVIGPLCLNPRAQKKERRDRTRVSDLSSQKDGGYLLSLRTSTIGAIGLNFSVRNGKRWIPNAITT